MSGPSETPNDVVAPESQSTNPAQTSSPATDGRPEPLPIEEWEKRLIGKRLIGDDETVEETSFKRSDLPLGWRRQPGPMNMWFKKDRLNVWIKSGIVESVKYR